MTDIQSIRVGETIRSAGMVKKADGDAIVAGTCNYYLLRLSDGEYWNDAANDWTTDQAKTGNAMTHRGDGLWTVELTSSPFAAGAVYVEWAEESGGLHVPAEGRLLRGVNAVAVDGDGRAETNVKQVDDEDVSLGAIGVVGLKKKT